jgi:hypothetical protein
MLNNQFEKMIEQLKSGQEIDTKTFFIMLGSISKLNKSINRFSEFILNQDNLKESLRLCDLAQQLMKTDNKGSKDKKVGNLIISILSGQAPLLHMLQSKSMSNDEYKQQADNLKKAHISLFKTAKDSKINLDGRGVLGVYHIIEELGGLNQENLMKDLKTYICARVRSNISKYPKGCDINEVAMTFNKLANHPAGFETEQQLLISFIIDTFYPDFAAGNTKNMRIQFKNFTSIFWGMSKVITQNKDLVLREKTIGFVEAFIDEMSSIEISDYDFLSINLFFESMVGINAMTDEYSLKY